MAVGDTNLQSCSIKLSVGAVLNHELDLSTPDDSLSRVFELKLSNGTGAEAGNQMWHDRRTLANGASDNLDMYGVLTNFRGETVNFAVIRAVILSNRVLNTSTLRYGGAAANPWFPMFANSSDIGVIPLPGATYPAYVCLTAPDAAGFPVGAASADIFKIAHGGEASADLTYDIIIIGEQA
jgi:hypothetical protein